MHRPDPPAHKPTVGVTTRAAFWLDDSQLSRSLAVVVALVIAAESVVIPTADRAASVAAFVTPCFRARIIPKAISPYRMKTNRPKTRENSNSAAPDSSLWRRHGFRATQARQARRPAGRDSTTRLFTLSSIHGGRSTSGIGRR